VAGCGGSKSKSISESLTEPTAAPRDTLALQIFVAAQDTAIAPWVARWPAPEAGGVATPGPSSTPDETIAMIYRVQIFTTKQRDAAITVRDEAQAAFGEEVRVDFETPYYKVRVGVFRTPLEAEPLLNEARRLGYRGAWAVRVRAPEDID
jgi:hypothetical protein